MSEGTCYVWWCKIHSSTSGSDVTHWVILSGKLTHRILWENPGCDPAAIHFREAQGPSYLPTRYCSGASHLNKSSGLPVYNYSQTPSSISKTSPSNLPFSHLSKIISIIYNISLTKPSLALSATTSIKTKNIYQVTSMYRAALITPPPPGNSDVLLGLI